MTVGDPATMRRGHEGGAQRRGEDVLAALRDEMPSIRILTDPVDLEGYRTDETAYLRGVPPLAVALPTTTDEVARLVRLAADLGVPVVPRGAGSGLSGGSAAIAGGLTIALTRMDRILEIDRDNLVVVTQPGVLNSELKAAVAAEGLFYAPDPASTNICSIGGNIATNAGGLCCVKYGQTRESVLGLVVVLADGSVIRTGGKNIKDVAGYSLTSLFVGSGGTLGIITEATLRLRPMPPPRATLIAFFPSVQAAGSAVMAISAAGVGPATIELMDRFTIATVDDWLHLGLDRDAEAMLLIESDLPGDAATVELEAAADASRQAGATLTVRSTSRTEADLLQHGRREAYHALERLGAARMEDIGVPRAMVPEMLVRIQEISAASGVRIGTFGHVGDGNLHPTLVFERDEPAAERLTAEVRTALYATALELGGTVTAEHGVGTIRKEWLEVQHGAGAVKVMRAIKAALDPDGILNPGRIL